MCRLVATAVETVAVARFALCAVLAVVIELAVCLRLMFRRCDTDRCSCEGPPRSSSACVLLVRLSKVARRSQGQGHTPERVPAAAGCLYLGITVSDNCRPRVHAREKTRRRLRPLREGAAAAAGRAPNGTPLPCAK